MGVEQWREAQQAEADRRKAEAEQWRQDQALRQHAERREYRRFFVYAVIAAAALMAAGAALVPLVEALGAAG